MPQTLNTRYIIQGMVEQTIIEARSFLECRVLVVFPELSYCLEKNRDFWVFTLVYTKTVHTITIAFNFQLLNITKHGPKITHQQKIPTLQGQGGFL